VVDINKYLSAYVSLNAEAERIYTLMDLE